MPRKPAPKDLAPRPKRREAPVGSVGGSPLRPIGLGQGKRAAILATRKDPTHPNRLGARPAQTGEGRA